MDLLYDSILQPLKNGKEDTHASVRPWLVIVVDYSLLSGG